jgi:hypothetical protein
VIAQEMMTFRLFFAAPLPAPIQSAPALAIASGEPFLPERATPRAPDLVQPRSTAREIRCPLTAAFFSRHGRIGHWP